MGILSTNLFNAVPLKKEKKNCLKRDVQNLHLETTDSEEYYRLKTLQHIANQFLK